MLRSCERLPDVEQVPAADRYSRLRAATERLCEPLDAEDCVVQSMPDASPAKWHLAHTTWFFEEFVLGALRPDEPPFHPRFRFLFNSYYDAVGDRHPRPRRGLLTRPTLGEVLEYRRHVDVRMLDALETGLPPDLAAVVEIGLHHEQQHQELMLTDIKHLLWCNPLRPAYAAEAAGRRPLREIQPAASPSPEWISFPERLEAIGHAGEGFGYDNERPRHRVFLAESQLASQPVTCGEFLAFIEDGGYQRPDLWLSDGWDVARAEGWEAPLYWERQDGRWSQFTLAGMQPLIGEEPVCHVSFYEADAFTRWAGARLPEEAEWEIAAAGVTPDGNFVESELFHPKPNGRLEGNGEKQGSVPHQMFGDVWEWTGSPYRPYPGYQPPAGALGEYNGKFMCNQMVLRGGSCATPADHIRASYRNFFMPEARWQFSGFRLARDPQATSQ